MRIPFLKKNLIQKQDNKKYLYKGNFNVNNIIKKKEFKPLEGNKVKIYTYGPTVYDFFT